ncbi:MAG: integrin alpha [Pseudomonadota bacterium]
MLLQKYHYRLMLAGLCLLPTFSFAANLGNLSSRNQGVLISTQGANEQLCAAASPAGDINNDGMSDFIMGAPGAGTVSGSGNAYLIFGSTQFNSTVSNGIVVSGLNGSNGFAVLSDSIDDALATTVARAGDINNDGIDDVMIAAPGIDTNNQPNTGQVAVMFGRTSSNFPATVSRSSLTGGQGILINGVSGNDRIGVSLSGNSDINNDGIDDMLIGAPVADGEQAGAGAAYVVFGSEQLTNLNSPIDLSNLDGTNGFAIHGAQTGDNTGISVAFAGDINRDGIGDMLIGANAADPNGIEGAGRAYIIFGKQGNFPAVFNLSNLNTQDLFGFVVTGANPFDDIGRRVSPAGDINGDGFNDVLISGFSNLGENANVGTLTILFGGRRLNQVNGA